MPGRTTDSLLPIQTPLVEVLKLRRFKLFLSELDSFPNQRRFVETNVVDATYEQSMYEFERLQGLETFKTVVLCTPTVDPPN